MHVALEIGVVRSIVRLLKGTDGDVADVLEKEVLFGYPDADSSVLVPADAGLLGLAAIGLVKEVTVAKGRTDEEVQTAAACVAAVRNAMRVEDEDEQPMGELLPPGPPLAELMGAEIVRAMGELPNPRSLDRAISLAAAARDFLTAMSPPWPTPNENLERLVRIQGAGDDSDDAP